jgi:hypothetical protein
MGYALRARSSAAGNAEAGYVGRVTVVGIFKIFDPDLNEGLSDYDILHCRGNAETVHYEHNRRREPSSQHSRQHGGQL